MTPFITRCALAGALATTLVLGVLLLASGFAYEADQAALRATYGSTLAEQLAASAIDPLLADEALRLTSLTQEMTHLSGVAWAALFDLDGRRLAGGEGAPAQRPPPNATRLFQYPLVFGREQLGTAAVALPETLRQRTPVTALATSALLVLLMGALGGWLGGILERRLGALRQRLEAKLGRSVPQTAPLAALIQLIDPPQQIAVPPAAEGKNAALEAATTEEDSVDDAARQAYLLVINLFNQSQLSPAARQSIFARLGQALDEQLAGTGGRRGFLSGTGLVALLPQNPGSLDPALEAIQLSLAARRAAEAALAEEATPGELRFGLERLDDGLASTTHPEALLTTASEAVYRTITLAALARRNGLVIGDAVMRSVDNVGALAAEPVAASALAALGAQDPAWRIGDRPPQTEAEGAATADPQAAAPETTPPAP